MGIYIAIFESVIKSSKIAKILVFIFLSFSFSVTFAATPICYSLFSPGNAQISAEIQKIFSGIQEDLRQRSKVLAEDIARSPKGRVIYDAIIVGGGPQGAAIAAEIMRTNPNAKILIIEDSNSGGVFSKFGPSFTINSLEDPNFSGNNFPGIPVQIKDMNLDGRKFVSSHLVGNMTIELQKFSQTPILLENRVTDTQLVGGSEEIYAVKTNQNIEVWGRRVIQATGGGDAIFRGVDKQSELLIQKEMQIASGDPNYLPGIEYVDTLLQKANQLYRQNQLLVDRYAGKKIGVIAAGDGGKIAVEFFLNQILGPKGSKLIDSLIWLGQKTTAEEYLASLKGLSLERYRAIAEFFNSAVTGINQKATGVEMILVNGEKKFKINFPGGSEIVDHVIVATGYDGPGATKSLFKGAEALQFKEINLSAEDFSPYQEHRKTLRAGKKVVGKNLFVMGSASGFWDNKLKNTDIQGGLLDTIMPLCRAFGRAIGLAIGNRPTPPVLAFENSKDSLHPLTVGLPAAPMGRVDTRVSSIKLKLALADFLLKSNFSYQTKTKVVVTVSDSGLVSVQSGGRGLTSASSRDWLARLRNADELLLEIAGFLRSSGAFSIEFETDSLGLSKIESINLR